MAASGHYEKRASSYNLNSRKPVRASRVELMHRRIGGTARHCSQKEVNGKCGLIQYEEVLKKMRMKSSKVNAAMLFS